MRKTDENRSSRSDKSSREMNPSISIGANESGRRIGLLEVIVAAVTYLTVQVLGTAVAIVAFGIQPEQLLEGGEATLILVATAAASALVAALVANVMRVRSLAAIGLRSTTGRWLLIGAGAGLLGLLVNRVVIIVYVWISGDSSNPQQGMADTAISGSLPQFALLILFGGLLTPLGEELLFRGVLFGWLRRWGFVLAAVISSIIFGIAHGVSVVLPAAIILGLLAAYVYERSGSIWPAFLVHAVNNTLLFIVARVFASYSGVPGA